ncbi:hypothetical protein [Campylobacter ureolyticus]|uniref:hypothetical protein n=1 Tax=Campylobacter ureolyticus TaxID=827 RepID=UPI001FC8C543|nr:hypothetical protein [Campylobacter ureolyticus]MCZ6105617.1 hypothetical protein [Campylobacter ureolyticus]MCZ6158148.1 hypothetical protein [Campylobacter ureolyticus]GKH60700.1 hypothetical protein CE91St25_10360 [Campylobacter ureolyticus]
MTYDVKLSNIDSNFLEVLKSLIKIYPNSNIDIKNSDYTFDDLNDETKKSILDDKNVSKSFNSIDELMKDLKS